MTHRPLLLGHRGCRGAHPENTIAAFEYALASGCDGFEFDVRLTGDGKAIICHDARLGKLRVSTTVYEKFLNNQTRSGRLLKRRARGELCCLDDVLEQFGRSAFLYIELKVPGLEEMVLATVGKHKPHRFVIASFLPTVVRRVNEIAPEVPVGFIFDNLAGLRRWRDMPGSHVMPHWRFATERRIRVMHEAGKKVMTWTVNSPRKMSQLAKWGIDAIVSDDPALLSNTLGGNAGLTT